MHCPLCYSPALRKRHTIGSLLKWNGQELPFLLSQNEAFAMFWEKLVRLAKTNKTKENPNVKAIKMFRDCMLGMKKPRQKGGEQQIPDWFPPGHEKQFAHWPSKKKNYFKGVSFWCGFVGHFGEHNPANHFQYLNFLQKKNWKIGNSTNCVAHMT